MNRLTKFFLRTLKYPPQLVYALGLGPIYGRLVLLLTTIGRKSGQPRVTPLQYEEIDGIIYVAAARGQQADWFRNIVANPKVEVRVKDKYFHGLAEPITDPARIADFLELRFERHPWMLRAMFRAQGWSSRPNRGQLEQYAANRAMVVIRPVEHEE
ncbi:MAG: nitroreductase family deazaflavin-dependent oxidoreductase [Anaerolineae bacterium]|nr:nitroreductase family deazaflavin-dependent oxidoreductase [Anaerolineae bacterium]